MGDVKRWHRSINLEWVTKVYEVVLASDFDALREELAKSKKETMYKHAALEAKAKALTAAEQRNAELVELLREVFYTVGYWNVDTCGRVEAALQPTESGASE